MSIQEICTSDAVRESRGGDHPVQQGQNVPFAPRLDNQLSPAPTDSSIPRQAINCLDHLCKFGHVMSSVVSVKGNGLNQPLTGQAKRSLTKPSFLRGFTRFSRYSPQSIRSTSNLWPGFTPSCWRILAGRTICPLVDTVVVIRGKIPSYPAAVKPRSSGKLIKALKVRHAGKSRRRFGKPCALHFCSDPDRREQSEPPPHKGSGQA